MIYFDNAATTKPIKIKQFDSFVSIFFGNPSSRHKLGKASKEIIDESRAFIANSLNCKINDIYFTSGGTQANNIVFNTAYNIFLETGKNENDIKDIQIYVKPEEHAAYYVVNGEYVEGGRKVEL